MSKILSVTGLATIVVVAAAAGFIGGAYTTAKAAFSGALAVTALDVKVVDAKKEKKDEKPEKEDEEA